MMSTASWFEHFKEKLQGLTGSLESPSPDGRLLSKALLEGHLSSEEYFSWAMTHYQLPMLHSRFFTETPPTQEMFAKWATHYPWTEECLPVAEWDGSLIVACLAPPQDFPSTCIPVLAEAKDLQATWTQLKTSAPASAPELNSSSDAPDGIDLSIPSASAPSDSFSFEDLGVDPETPDLEASTENEGEDLEGLEGLELKDEAPLDGIFDGPTSVKLESLTPEVSTEATVANEPQEEIAAESELTKKEVVAADVRPDINEPLMAVEPVSQIPIPTPPNAPEIPAPVETASYKDLSEKTHTEAPTEAVIPLTPRQRQSSKPTTAPALSGSFRLEKIKKKFDDVLHKKVQQTFKEMKNHFEKVMILTVDDDETQVTAFAWDETFKGIKDTNIRVSLDNPSIFRIVSTTQKPFHGYISLNEINEKFFEDWNQGVIPDHVTLAPLVVGEQMVGMLMGFADKSAYNKTSLGLAEKLSTEFVKDLAA